MSKPPYPVLGSGPVRLRLLEEPDLPLTLDWRNQDHIRRWFFKPDLISPEQHVSWFARYRDRDDDFVFIIEETKSLRRPVGQLAIYHVDRGRRMAEFGRLLIGDPEASGRGLAQRATALLVDDALHRLGLAEVYLEVYADNLPAIAVYRACGFRETANAAGVVRMTKQREAGS